MKMRFLGVRTGFGDYACRKILSFLSLLCFLGATGCDSVSLNQFISRKPAIVESTPKPTQNAHESFDYFLDQFRKKRGERFLIRASFLGNGESRVPLWVGNVQVKGGQFKAVVMETSPKGFYLQKGATVKFSRSQIVDWIVIRKGVIYGGFTERPKL